MAQDKVTRYLENRKKRLEGEGRQTNVSVPSPASGSYGSADKVNNYLKKREERIAGSGYEQKLRQRDVIVGQRAQEKRMRDLADATARQEAENAVSELEDSLGAFDTQREYNIGRMNSLMKQDRERRMQSPTDNRAALAALQQRAKEATGYAPEPEEAEALPAFKRQSLTGNARFAQAEADGEYNPYEDALAAMKRRMAEQAAQRAKERANAPKLEELLGNTPMISGNLPMDQNAVEQRMAIERIKRDEEERAQYEAENPKPEPTSEGGFNPEEWAEANAKAGWTQIGGRIMQGINAAFEPAQAAGIEAGEWLLRKMRGDEYADMFAQTIEEKKEEPALGGLYHWAVDPMNKATEYADAVNEEGGYLAKLGGSVIQNAVNMIPNAITALMTGGANTALDAFNRAQTTFGGAVLQSAKEMAKNPNFLMSFAQMYGGRYEDAVAGGASPYQAALTSTITTLFNSMVEMGGGVENLPFTKATIGDWVKNALDEGKEEVIQQVIDQMGQKAFVDGDIPWYSMEDENAVINPKVLGENALMGALAGGLIGGPGMAVNNALNGNAPEQTEQFEGAPQMSDIAMELAQEENARKMDEDGKYPRMSGDEIARMAQEAADAEIAEEQTANQPAAQTAPIAQDSRQEPTIPQSPSATAPFAQGSLGEAAQNVQDEAQKRQFVRAAEKYGEAATVFASNYEGSDVQAYDRAFNALYTAGKVNLGLDQMSSATDYLTAGVSNEHKMAIWQAGRNAEAATVTPGVKQMTTAKLSDRQKRQARMLDEIAKRYGYEIDIVDSINSGMANGAYAGGRKITVAADAAEEAIVQTGVHELVHALKRGGENEFNVLKDVVLEHLAATGDFDLEYSVKERIDQYRSAGQNADREYAIEEIVAEAVPTFLTDEKAVRAFVQRDQTLAQKIRDFFVNFAREIREIAEKYMQGEVDTVYDSGRYEIAALLGKSDALTEIAETFDRAMEAAGENEAAPGGETVFARNETERNRALKLGEMKNEFEKALSTAEWADYFEHLNAPGYNADLFDDKERTYMMRGNKVLLMEMQKNGEFSVIGVYRSRYGWYDVGIETVLEGWEEQEYGQEKIESWLASFAAHDGPALFERYDRHGRRFVRIDGKTDGTGRGAAGVSGGRYSLGTGIREDAVGQEQGDGSVEKSGISVSDDGEIAYPAVRETMYSLRTLPETDYIKERYKAAAALAKRMDIDLADAQRYIDNLSGVAAMIAADRARLDYEHESAYSAVKPNSDYKWTVDFSTLCKKRLLYTGTFDAIQSKLHDTVLTEDDYIRLRDMMAKKGYEVACAFCYVENRRKNNGEIINKFLDIYREAEKNDGVMELGPSNRRKTFRIEKGFSPEIADFNTSEGIANILHNHKDVYAAYMYFMNARGVSKPKLIESRTDYTNEILSKFKSASAVRAMNRRGGLRLQSFSDFEVINLLDMMQVVTDMARVGLMSQAYTKVPEFARVFGGTGVKINLSLVTKGVDKNGKLIFDDVEGMPHEEAFRIREMYSENVGTILVGRDDATIRAAMKDPRIDFIIPYHASGWSTENQAALGIAGYTNYTMGQNETNAATGKGTKNFYPAEYWDFSKNGDENAEIYLQKCAESGKTPKFPQFAGESGYWKMLIDFKMYDNEGKGVPQRAVRPDVNMAEAKKVLDEYKGGHVKLPVAQDIVDEFLAEYREAHPVSETRFSLNNTAPIESVMAEDQRMMLPADVDVRAESIKGAAASALSRGISERMEQQIAGVANKILRETGSGYGKAEFIGNIRALIDEYADGGATEETLRAVAEMAKKIIESSSRADNTLREQYADLRKKLRETGISLTETQKQEAANEAGSYNAYRQSLMGTVKLTNDGISLDAIWGELSGQYPELFPADAGEGEMIGKLTDFMMLMKPKYENPYGMDMDGAALEMAMRIQADVMGIIGAKDAAKAMYGTAEKFRKQYEAEFKAKLAQQKKERVEKFQQIAAELRAAKATGDAKEQAKTMSRYRAAMKATALDEAWAEVRATYKEREAQKAENRKANEMRGRVARQAGELMKMFTRPEKGRRIPTQLQGLVLEALEALDLNGTKAETEGRQTQKAAAFREKLTGIRKFYEDVMNSQSRGEAPEGLDGLMMTISERNLSDMQEALEVLGSGDRFYLRDMNSDQLRSLESLLKNIRHTVESVGKLWRMQRYANVIELGDASIEEMDSRDEQKLLETSAAGKARDFLALDMMEPVSYGERLGEGGRSVIQSLMDGEKIKFARIREAAAATEKMRRDAGVTGYDIGKWRKNVRTVKLGSGRVVKMSDVNIMELYLTANRPQGMQHLLGNGMRIRTTGETGAQTAHVQLSEADIRNIAGMMTEKQRRIADMMQKYLSGDVAKWGNDVTQRMYLYDAFTEDRYWPLTSDPNNLKTQEPEGDRAFSAIVNAGFTKPLNQLANNPVIIGDAFETFSRHIGEMASYAGYAEAMTDTMAWINYRQRTEDGLIAGSVKQSMERLLGTGGQKYLTKLVQDINGARRGGDNLRLANALLRNYKANAVAGKIRVAIQQPTSIVRAAAEMNPAYLLTGLKAGRGAVAEMQKWSSLAWWKSHGNYDIGIGKSTDEVFWGDTKKTDTVMEKISTTGGLIDPGKMDDWAWARIWSAVKREIRRTRPDLAEGSDEYFRAVAQRFEYIVDRTQVVDTVMHRSDMMRSRDGLIQTLTSFKAEPTKSYNMLMRAIMEAGRNPKDKKAYAKLIRTTGAFAASAAATAAATALFDAFKNRDDEDDLWTYLTEGEFWKDYVEAWLNSMLGSEIEVPNTDIVLRMGGNADVLSSIPFVGEAIEAAQGRDITMMQFEGVGNTFNALTTFIDHFFGENAKKTTKWGAIKPALTAFSQTAGLPISGLIANAEMLTRIYDPKLMQTRSEMAKLDDAYRVLYEAMAGGDTKKAANVRAQLTKGLHGNTPKNPKEIDTGIAHALAEHDERVMKAYDLRTRGDSTKELLALKKQIMADGFTDAQVTAAINYCETLKDTEETEKDMTAQLKAKMFESKDLFNSIRNGDLEDVAAVAEYLESVSEAKDPAKSIKSSVSGEFRQEYLELIENGRTSHAAALAKKFAAVGIDEEDLAGWVKDDRYEGMKEAVEAGDGAEAREIIRALTESGTSTSGIVSSLNGRFRELYIGYMRSGQRTQANRLREVLQGLGLYWKDGRTNYYRDEVFEEWLEEAE